MNKAADPNQANQNQNDKPLPSKLDQHNDVGDGDGLLTYKMESNPRGLAIIINNQNIEGKDPRKGAEKDGEKLRNLFSFLGFKVEIKNELTAENMKKTLNDKAEKYDHEAYDCLLVTILTHGEEVDKLLGTDGKSVSLIDLIKLFDGDKCKSLLGKPKIFFVQACRGCNRDDGKNVTDGASLEFKTDVLDEADSRGLKHLCSETSLGFSLQV